MNDAEMHTIGKAQEGHMLRALSWTLATFLLAPVIGFFVFLASVDAASGDGPRKADVIVALSGDPRRVLVAADLLKQGFSRRLIVAGQDNAEEIQKVRASNPALFDCCITVDQSSTNTAEDARRVGNILGASVPGSVLLVTSSFHVPRARSELRRVLPHSKIMAYGLPDDFYRPSRIFSDAPVASAFISQYLKYLGSWLPWQGAATNVSSARPALQFLSDIRTLAALAILVVTALFVIFAASKHRHQRSALRRSTGEPKHGRSTRRRQ